MVPVYIEFPQNDIADKQRVKLPREQISINCAILFLPLADPFILEELEDLVLVILKGSACFMPEPV